MIMLTPTLEITVERESDPILHRALVNSEIPRFLELMKLNQESKIKLKRNTHKESNLYAVRREKLKSEFMDYLSSTEGAMELYETLMIKADPDFRDEEYTNGQVILTKRPILNLTMEPRA